MVPGRAEAESGWHCVVLLEAIDLKKKIFRRWIDERPHIGDIPRKETAISL
jgi:hypothetical protein